ncbi:MULTISPECIES: hypothetical protein [Bacillaceae]|uniref:Uncharacterized protein n=1 Tax=Evansella alkalicola TaxID=745819 RepID=A0ABS6JUW1_9BACI|nr:MULTISPECIES: hypothetical protein [Bacillaceae]MBU9722363.1 hypothetical protein [Bacillus alkalicola]
MSIKMEFHLESARAEKNYEATMVLNELVSDETRSIRRGEEFILSLLEKELEEISNALWELLKNASIEETKKNVNELCDEIDKLNNAVKRFSALLLD